MSLHVEGELIPIYKPLISVNKKGKLILANMSKSKVPSKDKADGQVDRIWVKQ